MTTEHRTEAPGYGPAAGRGSEETLPFPLVVLLHLLPGALLIGAVLLLAPAFLARDLTRV